MKNKLYSDQYNPLDIILKIQRLKFKALALPLILIIIGFSIYSFLKIDAAKYLSLAGLLYYAFISMRFYYRKNVPPQIENAVLSPVNGRVIEVDPEQRVVILKKGFFSPADVRRPSSDTILTFSVFSTKFVMLDHQTILAGKLIGILPGTALCNCMIPTSHSFVIEANQRVIAGETVLAELTTKKDPNKSDEN